MTYPYRFWPLILSVIGVLVASECSRAVEQLFISEFMALNRTTLADEDGQFSDWIEIYNPGATSVNLDGWYLTDDRAKLTKWRFPATNLPPFSFMTVFASGKNRATPGAPLHTSFSLNGAGEYLGLVKPDGTNIASEFAPAFPPQFPDLSFGVEMAAD